MRRKLDPADFGLTEEEWVKLPEDRKLYFRRKAYHMRNGDKRRAYQLDYYHRVGKYNRVDYRSKSLWKPQESTSTERAQPSNDSRE
jgi:hypothetical protein